MKHLRIRNTGEKVDDEYLWTVEERGWLFWPMFANAFIWAKTATEAERIYLHGSAGEGAP